MKKYILTGLLLTTAIQSSSFGSGMLIPKDRSIPPLAIKHQRVDIRIKDGVATAKIEQVFKNSVNRDLEAVYVFPLPENASDEFFKLLTDRPELKKYLSLGEKVIVVVDKNTAVIVE